jgi:hypothetical protein
MSEMVVDQLIQLVRAAAAAWALAHGLTRPSSPQLLQPAWRFRAFGWDVRARIRGIASGAIPRARGRGRAELFVYIEYPAEVRPEEARETLRVGVDPRERDRMLNERSRERKLRQVAKSWQRGIRDA